MKNGKQIVDVCAEGPQWCKMEWPICVQYNVRDGHKTAKQIGWFVFILTNEKISLNLLNHFSK